MVKAIMHGCNGKMGQVITGLIKADEAIEIVAGIDTYTGITNDYPVFESIEKCDVKADVIIDFSNSAAADRLLDFCADRQIPVVLCTTGLSEEQLAKVDEAAKKVAVLKSCLLYTSSSGGQEKGCPLLRVNHRRGHPLNIII